VSASCGPADIETTALGAAYLAGLATGFFKSLGDLEKFWRAERTFEPGMDKDRREELFAVGRRRWCGAGCSMAGLKSAAG